MSKYIFYVVVIFLAFSQPALAYIDPGTGSFVFQMIVGAVLGFFFIIKLYFHKIKTFFLKIFKGKKHGNEK
ncbi:MAG: hypothetical protein K9M44_01835 [Candidatus Pacebacteria bacterium]|nr:hypothetical protein [Candidatus Paceibacterota bacterium]